MSDYARLGLRDLATAAPTHPVAATSAASTASVQEYLFSPRVRHGAIVYVAATVPLIVLGFWDAHEPASYLQQMTMVSAFYSVPGLVLAGVAARRADARDRVARWLWFGCFAFGVVASLTAIPRMRPEMDPHVLRTAVPVLATLVVLIIANTLTMRSRSGHRAALVDATDLVMATIALLAPLGLFFGPSIATTSRPWFTVTAALWTVVGLHGTLVALTVRSRIQPGYRVTAEIGVAFGAAVTLSGATSTWLGIQEFDIATGPVAGAFALSVALGVLFFVYTPRHGSPGLERLPPAAQVRRNSLIAMVTLVAVPVVAGAVWYQRDHSWIPEAGLFTVLVLVSLSSLRHLLVARETTRLYDLVEESARVRGNLLGEIVSHVDGSRHRAAAHLHRQAASLYAGVASFSAAIDQAASSGNPEAMRFAAERLRHDLGQRAERLQRLAEAVKPVQPSDDDSRRLGAPMRALIENLALDGPRPALEFDVCPDLALDWATETAVLRIVQEATVHAWWVNGATNVKVSVTGTSDGVVVEVIDDGTAETEPHNLLDGEIGSTARFLGGEVTSEALPDGGTRVSALIPTAGPIPAEPQYPALRLVSDRDGQSRRDS